MNYSPRVFDVGDLPQAKAIILTPEGGSTEERWEKETPWIAGLCVEHLGLGPKSTVLDYGCGVGRLTREIVRRTGARVIGADISVPMLALACPYVDDWRFMTCHPLMIPHLGVRFDAVVSVWVLQHCENPFVDLRIIREAMKPGAPMLVVNNVKRAVPTDDGRWADDGIDIRATLDLSFDAGPEGKLPAEIMPDPQLSDLTFWKVYRAKGD